MNSLEFVNKLINEYKKSKENFIRLSKLNPDKEAFIKCASIREEELKHLQQIKTELIEYNEIKKYGISYENFKKKEAKDEKNE